MKPEQINQPPVLNEFVHLMQGGMVLVPAGDLRELAASLNGDCYRGDVWEIKCVQAMLKEAEVGNKTISKATIQQALDALELIGKTVRLKNFWSDEPDEQRLDSVADDAIESLRAAIGCAND